MMVLIRGPMIPSERWYTISNMLTLSRLILTPGIVYGILGAYWKMVFGLFFIAACTDLLDGYLARLFEERTQLGALLDPIVDKILLLSCFIALTYNPIPGFSMPSWFPFFLVIRELVLIIGTGTVLFLRPNLCLGPTLWGKLTTFFQIALIFSLFVCFFAGWQPLLTYNIALISLALFTCFSLLDYVRRGITYVKKDGTV